ncbi:MAG: single-stranded-DNA-specific exonuclease RecJ [Ruminococcaceae bacterium]|nr:single-stranded-DNA-specific exonuclease RecJ [Oscillospiraceae bacterium]
MAYKKWQVKTVDRIKAKELALECDVEPIVALIAASRGYTDPTDLEQFLSDEPYFSDAYELIDIMHAADMVNLSISENKKIAVYGDYDCDGVTATALLYKYLKGRGADCIYYIPDRFSEGYGMNCDAVRHLKELGVDLIITVDNGISCYDEIALANSLGMTVVVTDHHLPPECLPEAAAIVDPHRKDCPSSFKAVCGAEVAFKLICVMEGAEPEELLPLYADILSVAVIADIMPLTLENRIIVKYGIRKFKQSACLVGLRALLNVAGVNLSDVNASRIAFGICPRINAAGRMGNAARAVELLVTDDMMHALEIANEIDSDNALRQQTEKKICDEAITEIEQNGYCYDRVIVVDGVGWHHGVVGIVASRICEKYGKPAIVISRDGDTAHGSGRSYEGFSLYDAINSASGHLIKFGGHSQAAGVSLLSDKINDFRVAVNNFAAKTAYAPPILNLDCKINPAALTVDLSESIKTLEPFGYENPEPLFGVFGVTLQRITPIGNNKHLKLLFSKGDNAFQALAFGLNAESFCYNIGDTLDLAVTVSTNIFNGNYTVNVVIKEMRLSNIEEDTLFDNIQNFEAFKSGRKYSPQNITPTRSEVGSIYRAITPNGILAEKLINMFLQSLGYAKTKIALDTLLQLNLIKLEKGKYYLLQTTEKTNLLNSPIFGRLTKECEQLDRN